MYRSGSGPGPLRPRFHLSALFLTRRGAASKTDSMPLTWSAAALLVLLGASEADPSRSIGHPFTGRLRGAVELTDDAPEFTLRWTTRAHRWTFGTRSLVKGVRWTARQLSQPGAAPLVVGNLSRRGGGDLPCSRSHNTGRDVDFGLFMRDGLMADGLMADGKGRGVASRYYRFGRDGRSLEAAGRYEFDSARNWELVKSLLENPHFVVSLLVLNPHLEQRILEHARRVGEPEGLVARAEALISLPAYANLHRNHLHVRIACPSGHEHCAD